MICRVVVLLDTYYMGHLPNMHNHVLSTAVSFSDIVLITAICTVIVSFLKALTADGLKKKLDSILSDSPNSNKTIKILDF